MACGQFTSVRGKTRHIGVHLLTTWRMESILSVISGGSDSQLQGFAMKRVLTASVAAAAMSMFIGGAQAADMEYEQAIQGLVVSGYVEKWSGYTFTASRENNATSPDSTGYFTTGTSGRLSLPLGSNLTMQMDAGLEYTENSFTSNADNVFQHSG